MADELEFVKLARRKQAAAQKKKLGEAGGTIAKQSTLGTSPPASKKAGRFRKKGSAGATKIKKPETPKKSKKKQRFVRAMQASSSASLYLPSYL
jgi:hypothetical protein